MMSIDYRNSFAELLNFYAMPGIINGVLQINAPPQFIPVGEVLTPQCPGLAIEGSDWNTDAVITQMDCYGSVVDLRPENAGWVMERRHVNVLALSSLGLTVSEVAGALGCTAGSVHTDRLSLGKQMRDCAGATFNARRFIACIDTFVSRGVLQIGAAPEPRQVFPPYITEGIREWAQSHSLFRTAARLKMKVSVLESDLLGFRKQQGVLGPQLSGLVLYGHVQRMWPEFQYPPAENTSVVD